MLLTLEQQMRKMSNVAADARTATGITSFMSCGAIPPRIATTPAVSASRRSESVPARRRATTSSRALASSIDISGDSRPTADSQMLPRSDSVPESCG
jgi:hypothetical protein